jgi:hypothetical protein
VAALLSAPELSDFEPHPEASIPSKAISEQYFNISESPFQPSVNPIDKFTQTPTTASSRLAKVILTPLATAHKSASGSRQPSQRFSPILRVLM